MVKKSEKKSKKSPPKVEMTADDFAEVSYKVLLGIAKDAHDSNIAIVEAINTLIEAINSLKEKPYELKESESTSTTLPKKPTETPAPPREVEMTQPVPMEYRMIVNEVLNKDFGIKMEYMKDRPEFMFTVIVPEKYSPLTSKEKELCSIDLRSKVITYANGVNGVRTWVELIYKNFNPEVQARITSDRH